MLMLMTTAVLLPDPWFAGAQPCWRPDRQQSSPNHPKSGLVSYSGEMSISAGVGCIPAWLDDVIAGSVVAVAVVAGVAGGIACTLGVQSLPRPWSEAR